MLENNRSKQQKIALADVLLFIKITKRNKYQNERKETNTNGPA